MKISNKLNAPLLGLRPGSEEEIGIEGKKRADEHNEQVTSLFQPTNSQVHFATFIKYGGCDINVWIELDKEGWEWLRARIIAIEQPCRDSVNSGKRVPRARSRSRRGGGGRGCARTRSGAASARAPCGTRVRAGVVAGAASAAGGGGGVAARASRSSVTRRAAAARAPPTPAAQPARPAQPVRPGRPSQRQPQPHTPGRRRRRGPRTPPWTERPPARQAAPGGGFMSIFPKCPATPTAPNCQVKEGKS
ncbi:Protein of unknown function, partial [Gryllus bimaculatus]